MRLKLFWNHIIIVLKINARLDLKPIYITFFVLSSNGRLFLKTYALTELSTLSIGVFSFVDSLYKAMGLNTTRRCGDFSPYP